jgi:hypothetical protein
MPRFLHYIMIVLIAVALIFPAIPANAADYDIKFQVVSTSPIGATIRATINGSPDDVQMVVLNLDDIRKGLAPDKAHQQEIQYSEVSQVTKEWKEYRTGIMGDREVTIDDVIGRASPMPDYMSGNKTVELKYSKATTDYLDSVKVKDEKLKGKATLADTFKKAPKEAQADLDKLMAEMPNTIRDIVGYDIKSVEEEVKLELVKNKSPTLKQAFKVSEPMTLEATVTSGKWSGMAGWGSTGVLALIIDGVYYYDMSNSSWWSTAYAHRIAITIDQTKVDADLANYPVYLNISATSGIGDVDATAIFDELSANNLKMAITDSTSTTQFYTEIVSWDNVGETAELWVNVAAVDDAVDTVIYLYYDSGQADNSTYVGVTGSTPGKAVWDSNYVEVLHMNDGVDNAHITGSKTGTSYDKQSANHPQEVATGVGKAQQFNGSSDYILLGNDASLSFQVGSITMQLPDIGAGTGIRWLYVRKPNGDVYGDLGILWIGGNLVVCRNFGGDATETKVVASYATFADGDILEFVFNKPNLKVHLNGDGTPLVDFNFFNSDYLFNAGSTDVTNLGSAYPNNYYYFDGQQSEFRIYAVANTTAHIKANQYNWTDKLVTFGAEVSIAVPSVTTSAASAITTTTATLNGDVTSAGNGDLVTRGFEWDTDSGAPYLNTWGEGSSATGAFTYGLTLLTAGTPYYYRAFATNQAGTGYGAEVTFTTVGVPVVAVAPSLTPGSPHSRIGEFQFSFGILALSLFTFLAYWKSNSLIFMFAGAVSMLCGVFATDAIPGALGISVGLILIMYGLVYLAFAYKFLLLKRRL